MKRVMLLTQETQCMEEAENYSGEELIILIAVDSGTLATSFEGKMDALVAKAEEVQKKLGAKGVACRVLVEWSNAEEALKNCLTREQAELLNGGEASEAKGGVQQTNQKDALVQ
jgi:hypothetical protein